MENISKVLFEKFKCRRENDFFEKQQAGFNRISKKGRKER